MAREFASGRKFTEKGLDAVIARKWRELESFINRATVRFDDDGETVTLPSGLLVHGDGVFYNANGNKALTIEGFDGASRYVARVHAEASGEGPYIQFISDNDTSPEHVQFRDSAGNPIFTVDPVDTATQTHGDHIVDGHVIREGIGSEMTKSSTQAITAVTDTQLSWQTEVYDTHGSIADTANDEFSIPTGYGGLWMVNFTVSWDSVAPTRLRTYVKVNGTSKGFITRHDNLNQGTFGAVNGTQVLYLSAGDKVELWVYANPGITIRNSATNTRYSITKVG